MAKRLLKKYYIKAIRKLRHRRGYGVHSPFAFNLITKVIEEEFMYYSYGEIEQIRRERLRGKLSGQDLKLRKNISFKRGTLLFRLINRFNPDVTLEIGTSWGISSLYLHAAHAGMQHICIEPVERIAEVGGNLAKSVYPDIEMWNRPLEIGLSEVLKKVEKIDFVFIHRLGTDQYAGLFSRLAEKLSPEAVVVMNDINASAGLLKVWEELCRMPFVRVSMDLYDLGLVFCNEKLNKQHYIVAF